MKIKCPFTGEEALSKEFIIPKNLFSEELVHNWTKDVPISKDYKKSSKLPSETELEAHRLFYMLEIAKIHVMYYEERLKEVREKLNKPSKKQKERKKKEEKIMVKEYEIQKMSSKLDDVLNKKAKFWEEK